MTLDERIKLLEGCKWVDEIVVIEEYAVRLEFMERSSACRVKTPASGREDGTAECSEHRANTRGTEYSEHSGEGGK